MATAPEWRRRGVGSALLAAVIDHVATNGGGLLWCNARLGALGFYERAGFQARGDAWEEPVIGPHVAMWRFVAPAGPAPGGRWTVSAGTIGSRASAAPAG